MDNFSLKGQKVNIVGFVAKVNIKDILLFTYIVFTAWNIETHSYLKLCHAFYYPFTAQKSTNL